MRPKTETDIILVKKISSEVANAVEIAFNKVGLPMAMTDQDCLDMLEKTSGGFVISTMGQIISEKRTLKILSFNGVTPSLKTLADGSYPLFRELYFVTKTESSGPVRKFIDFSGSSSGRSIMEEVGTLVTMGRIKG
jgi:phosphate transport system substrate-binding protein